MLNENESSVTFLTVLLLNRNIFDDAMRREVEVGFFLEKSVEIGKSSSE